MSYIHPSIVADKDREIALFRWEIVELKRKNAALLNLLHRVERYIDAIVCYASTMNEHEPNRLAHDVREALKDIHV